MSVLHRVLVFISVRALYDLPILGKLIGHAAIGLRFVIVCLEIAPPLHDKIDLHQYDSAGTSIPLVLFSGEER
jgi:hypothetical protein